MEVTDFNALLAGLRNGLGFTKSCQIIHLNPQEVSETLRKDKGLYKEATDAVTYAGKALLVSGSALLADMNLGEWKKNMGRIQTFIYALTLWQDYAKKEEVTPKKAIEAYMLYRDWDETATAIGYTRAELNFFLFENPQVYRYVEENPHLFK